MVFARLEIDCNVARLVLDHGVGNRINFKMREELRDAVTKVGQSDARALLVTGEGSDFCHGGDVREWPGLSSEALRPKIEVYADALDALQRLPIPTVAAVQGGCFGGGFELALSCDMILAARSAKFGFPEVTLGILTLQGGMLQIAERVGPAKAAELVFLSPTISADQLQTWGVVNHVSEDANLAEEAEAWIQRLAAGATKAYAATKALWRIRNEEGLRTARARLYDISMPLFDTEDATIALRNAADALRGGGSPPTATFAGR